MVGQQCWARGGQVLQNYGFELIRNVEPSWQGIRECVFHSPSSRKIYYPLGIKMRLMSEFGHQQAHGHIPWNVYSCTRINSLLKPSYFGSKESFCDLEMFWIPWTPSPTKCNNWMHRNRCYEGHDIKETFTPVSLLGLNQVVPTVNWYEPSKFTTNLGSADVLFFW